jgi:hypothetical protein
VAVAVAVAVAVVVAVAVAVVTVTLGLGDVMALGLGDVVALGLGEVVLEGVVVFVVLRVGDKLEIALWTLLPHPAARHPTARIAAERGRLLLNRRMPDPSVPCLLTDAGQSHSQQSSC